MDRSFNSRSSLSGLATGLCALLLVSAHSLSWAHSEKPRTLKIASHELRPYHWLNDEGELEGPALASLNCILNDLEQDYQIDVFPWPRAQEQVRHKVFDAFFIASRNAKRDQYAQFSSPFYFDAWYFYQHPDTSFSLEDEGIKERYFGVLLGSNMENWLKKRGFNNQFTGQDYAHLFEILKLGRLDLVMSTKGIYKAQVEQHGWNPNVFVAEKVRDLEMGMYFGKHFIDAYPAYLDGFNAAAENCNNELAARRH